MSTIKEDLIQIAMKKIQISGIHSLTMRELGETVGIKSSSVMYHFKSKDGLIQEIINTYSEGFILYLEELNKMNLEPKDKLDKFVDIFESNVKENKFCLAGMLASQKDNIDETSVEKTRKFFNYAQEWVSKNLRNSENSQDLAKIIISSLEGAMMLDKLDEKTERLNAVRVWIKTL